MSRIPSELKVDGFLTGDNGTEGILDDLLSPSDPSPLFLSSNLLVILYIYFYTYTFCL